MRYQIVLAIPRFDNYDSIVGWRYERLPYAYRTEACARAIAHRLADGTDEVFSEVVPFDAPVYVERQRMSLKPLLDATMISGYDYDMPF